MRVTYMYALALCLLLGLAGCQEARDNAQAYADADRACAHKARMYATVDGAKGWTGEQSGPYIRFFPEAMKAQFSVLVHCSRVQLANPPAVE